MEWSSLRFAGALVGWDIDAEIPPPNKRGYFHIRHVGGYPLYYLFLLHIVTFSNHPSLTFEGSKVIFSIFPSILFLRQQKVRNEQLGYTP